MIVDTDELLDVQVEPALVDTTTKEKKKKKIQKRNKKQAKRKANFSLENISNKIL